MGEVGSDGFLEGGESDVIEDGNDQCGARRVCKTKTATAKRAVGIPNVSRRSDARAVEISGSSIGKWVPFRRFRSKRKTPQMPKTIPMKKIPTENGY